MTSVATAAATIAAAAAAATHPPSRRRRAARAARADGRSPRDNADADGVWRCGGGGGGGGWWWWRRWRCWRRALTPVGQTLIRNTKSHKKCAATTARSAAAATGGAAGVAVEHSIERAALFTRRSTNVGRRADQSNRARPTKPNNHAVDLTFSNSATTRLSSCALPHQPTATTTAAAAAAAAAVAAHFL